MATEPTLAPSQHSPDFSSEHHLDATRTVVRLVWPLDKRSGPLDPSEEGTQTQLWNYFRPAPAWPWNIRILDDGTVEQSPSMTQDEINESKWVLWGGHVYDVEEGSEVHQALADAGFEFVEVAG